MKGSGLLSFELKILLRNRWLLLTTILFSFLLAAISAIQTFIVGTHSGFSRQTAALLNVILFVLPLFSLALGSMGAAGDKESGWLALLKTYPVPMSKLVLSKFLALLLALSAVLLVGFGSALLVTQQVGSLSLYWRLFFLSFVLTAIFASLAIMIGFFARQRIQALTISLAVWAIFLLLVDYALLTLGTQLAGYTLVQVIIASIFLNPSELIRTWFLIWTGNGAILGPAFYEFIQFSESMLGFFVYLFVACAWIFLPLVLAIWKLRKGV